MNQMKRDVILKPNRKFYPEKNYSHQELVLHATLLCRIFYLLFLKEQVYPLMFSNQVHL